MAFTVSLSLCFAVFAVCYHYVTFECALLKRKLPFTNAMGDPVVSCWRERENALFETFFVRYAVFGLHQSPAFILIDVFINFEPGKKLAFAVA